MSCRSDSEVDYSLISKISRLLQSLEEENCKGINTIRQNEGAYNNINSVGFIVGTGNKGILYRWKTKISTSCLQLMEKVKFSSSCNNFLLSLNNSSDAIDKISHLCLQDRARVVQSMYLFGFTSFLFTLFSWIIIFCKSSGGTCRSIAFLAISSS